MRTIKVKALLLSLVAVLTLGLTSCTDELGDQTQGKPGYLTLNLKTLKPKSTKNSSDLSADYKKINNLNVLIYRSGNLLMKKYFTTQDGGGAFTNDASANTIKINVGQLNSTTDSVVVIANFGEIPAATDLSTMTALQAIEIASVGDFSTSGLVMTGISRVTKTDDFTYTSNVKVAPVISKISVNFTTKNDAAYYKITGVYIVNAINNIRLTTILRDGSNDTIKFLLTPQIKTASSGFPITSSTEARDYDVYAHTVSNFLKDEAVPTDSLTSSTLFSYYVGENYHADLLATRNSGTLLANSTANASKNTNTIILIKAEPKPGCPAWVTTLGTRYYTYDLSKNISSSTGTTNPNAILGAAGTGFSTKRKTNYIVSFSLDNIGTASPLERLTNLTVTVTADPWDISTTGTSF